MQIAIVGLAGSGKTTVFNTLTRGHAETGGYGGVTLNVGVVKVPDARLDTLAGIFKPKKIVQADVTYVDPAAYLHVPHDMLQYRARAKLAAGDVPAAMALARQYLHSGSLLDLSISLIRANDISDEVRRDYSGDLIALSVGRLESEKNPLALADVIAALRRLDPRWRLVVCGEGGLRGALERRIEELGVADAVELRGYVPHDAGLAATYREAHALAHVTWTEGLPQILYEAFAARLPVVATDVGGIREAVGDAAILVPPGDPQGIAEGLEVVGRDASVRDRLVERGLEVVGSHTLESESERAAEFIRDESGV